MRFKKHLILGIVLCFLGMSPLQAEETDQYTLPPTDLQDIGPAASRNLYAVLEKVVRQTNERIQILMPKATQNRLAASQLAERLDEVYLINEIYNSTGPGFPRWIRWNTLSVDPNQPIRYREIWPWKNIYWRVFTQSPPALLLLVDTVNMYGHYFGVDKLGHFFMQGHNYYRLYRFLLRHGKTPTEAQAIMVSYGDMVEQSYLGTMINGVFSNADLSANFAGFKFYRNLVHSIKIGDETLAPILVLKNNRWEIGKQIRAETLLKPYISDNFNEALNPCRYAFSRNRIRKSVIDRCPDWISRRGITKEWIQAKFRETRLWHGEEYGYWLPKEDAVTLEACFEGQGVLLTAIKLRKSGGYAHKTVL